MKTFLCPVDFTPGAASGFRYARQLARHLSLPTRIVLVHVYAAPVLPPSPEAAAAADAALQYEEEILARLDQMRGAPGEQADEEMIQYQAEVRPGTTMGAIARMAREENADLIFLGVTGADGTGQEGTAGYTTTDVLEMAVCPVLLVPEGAVFTPPARITVAADLQTGLSAQFDLVLQLARLSGAEVAFLHVLAEDTGPAREAAQRRLSALGGEIGYEPLSFHCLESVAVAEGIIRFLAGQQADLLVMTTHPHLSWKDFFAPSHTRHVATRINVPLLAIHG